MNIWREFLTFPWDTFLSFYPWIRDLFFLDFLMSFGVGLSFGAMAYNRAVPPQLPAPVEPKVLENELVINQTPINETWSSSEGSSSVPEPTPVPKPTPVPEPTLVPEPTPVPAEAGPHPSSNQFKFTCSIETNDAPSARNYTIIVKNDSFLLNPGEVGEPETRSATFKVGPNGGTARAEPQNNAGAEVLQNLVSSNSEETVVRVEGKTTVLPLPSSGKESTSKTEAGKESTSKNTVVMAEVLESPEVASSKTTADMAQGAKTGLPFLSRAPKGFISKPKAGIGLISKSKAKASKESPKKTSSVKSLNPFYDSFGKSDIREFVLETPAIALLRELMQINLLESWDPSNSSVAVFVKNRRDKFTPYYGSSLNKQESAYLWEICRRLDDKSLPSPLFTPSLIEKLENFLSLVELKKLSSVKLEFVGRRVTFIALTLYGYAIFENWHTYNQERKQELFEKLFKFMFNIETGFFAANLIEVILTENQDSRFTFNKADFRQSYLTFK